MHWLIPLVALLASCLTFFSGFGLGTLLMPAFALFYPFKVAVMLTAIVHLLNNLYKLIVTWKHIHWKVATRFGLFSIPAAVLGSLVLNELTELPAIVHYHLGNRVCSVTLLGLLVGIIIILFALWDIIPRLARMSFPSQWMPLGGVLSGFFGGLSGHQGVLRAAFLSRLNLTPYSFVGTGVVISCLVDLTRLTVYIPSIATNYEPRQTPLLLAATVAALVGAYYGNLMLGKMTIRLLQIIVGVMLVFFGLALAAGWL